MTEDNVVNKVPQNMGFDESNHILSMCFMKSMYYLTFLNNKQKIDIFMHIHPIRCHTPLMRNCGWDKPSQRSFYLFLCDFVD